MFLQRPSPESPVTCVNSCSGLPRRQGIGGCGRAGVYLVRLWASPLLQKTVDLSDVAEFGSRLFLTPLLLPQRGLRTTEDCGLVPGCQVRDRVSAKVQSAERDLFRWTYLSIVCPVWRKAFSRVHGVSGQRLNFLMKTVRIIAYGFILSSFSYHFAPPMFSASPRRVVNSKVI